VLRVGFFYSVDSFMLSPSPMMTIMAMRIFYEMTAIPQLRLYPLRILPSHAKCRGTAGFRGRRAGYSHARLRSRDHLAPRALAGTDVSHT
jgi:hypothetical protein